MESFALVIYNILKCFSINKYVMLNWIHVVFPPNNKHSKQKSWNRVIQTKNI